MAPPHLKVRRFEAVIWRLLLAGRCQTLVEVVGALPRSGCSLASTREASGQSPDPSCEFPDCAGQLWERPGDFLDQLGDLGDRGDQIRDEAGELAERRNAMDVPRRASSPQRRVDLDSKTLCSRFSGLRRPWYA